MLRRGDLELLDFRGEPLPALLEVQDFVHLDGAARSPGPAIRIKPLSGSWRMNRFLETMMPWDETLPIRLISVSWSSAENFDSDQGIQVRDGDLQVEFLRSLFWSSATFWPEGGALAATPCPNSKS